MHDGAPCHKGRVTQFLAEHGIEFETLPWPGNSLDMNPVEKVWAQYNNLLCYTVLWGVS